MTDDPSGRSAGSASDAVSTTVLAALRYARNRFDSSLRRAHGESDAEFVSRAYREMLERPPDADGLAAATRKLSRGHLRRGLLRREIRSSVEYRERERIRTWLNDAPAPPDASTRALQSPEEIGLELTTRCNMAPACVMCGYAGADSRFARTDMDPGIWRSLLPLLRGASAIGLHGAGEPLLYPRLFDLLGAIRGSRATVGFNSNGHLLAPSTSRRLVEAGLGWISVSLDAANAGTYLRIRRRGDFDLLLSKVRELRRIREELGGHRPEIEINMTVMRLNLGEVPAFVDLAAGLELDRVMFQQMNPGQDQRAVAPDGFVFDYREQDLAGDRTYDEVMEGARRRAEARGLGFSSTITYRRPSPEERTCREAEAQEPTSRPGAACGEPWRRLLVRATGDAYVCCVQLTNRVSLGRVPEDSIEEIWNGRRIRLVREAMFAGPAPFPCRGCFVTWGREA